MATDFADANEQHRPEDDGILDEAKEGIKRLNEKYKVASGRRFFLFHRKRIWNPAEGVWMGWERKRGKLSKTAYDNIVRKADRVIRRSTSSKNKRKS